MTEPSCMTAAELPEGDALPAVPLPHFPTRWQAVLWRNWGLVEVARLAAVLGTDPAALRQAAVALGLAASPAVDPRWVERGYITLIRRNWHLLPYPQLLQLLDWPAGRLAFALKEDDFLWVKLGKRKPQGAPVRYAPLSPEEANQTAWLRRVVADVGGGAAAEAPGEAPFAFLAGFERADPHLPICAAAQTAPQAATGFDLCLAYSYMAASGDPLGAGTEALYPEGLLQQLAAQGINGVWLHGLLYALAPWSHAPELAEGWQERLTRLRELTERAGRYGIGVYLYLNEPRGHGLAFFERHPDYRGAESVGRFEHALCTAHPEVLAFVRAGCRHVFEQVPQLAGVFCITMSENTTHCRSKEAFVVEPCPRCAGRSQAEVIAEVVGAIEAGVHQARPDARVLAWNWAWDPAWEPDLIERLPAGVTVLAASEEYLPFVCGGVANHVRDYTISRPGPSERSRGVWRQAQARGLATAAKMQVNCTWECSAVPWLPVPSLVQKHLEALRAEGVRMLMVSWTLGGYPGGNLGLLTQSAETLIASVWGAAAPEAARACAVMADAFEAFPFHVGVLYHAPQNFGPAHLLHAAPTGYPATMIGFSYDDLAGWRANYPEAVFAAQFRQLAEGWQRGAAQLAQVLAQAPQADAATQATRAASVRLAEVVACHFRSAYLQIEFVRRRDGRAEASTPSLEAICQEEAQLALRLLALVRADSRIGFEASNHYYYTGQDLLEKVLCCRWILASANRA